MTSNSYDTIFTGVTMFLGVYAWILKQTVPPPWYKGNLHGHSCKWIRAGGSLDSQASVKACLKKYGKSRIEQGGNSAGREALKLKTPAAYIPFLSPVNFNQFSL